MLWDARGLFQSSRQAYLLGLQCCFFAFSQVTDVLATIRHSATTKNWKHSKCNRLKCKIYTKELWKILQFTIILSTLCALQAKAQIATGYEVERGMALNRLLMTYSFDDNSSNQTSVGMPLFDKYGYKMSFNVISGSVSNWSVFISASNNGHEIASHGNAQRLERRWCATQDQELKNSQTTINSKITNAKCLTFIYPYCNIGDVNTMSKYYISEEIVDKLTGAQ